jgi:glycosyltransferase involved in cell wall biosynthesis
VTHHLPEEKIRVMRFIARLNIGGPAVHTVLLAHHMQALGYETMLVTGQVEEGEGDMGYLADSLGVKPAIISHLGRPLRSADDLIALFRILRLVFKFRPHIIHTHTAKAGTLGRIAAFIYNRAHSSKVTAQSWMWKMMPGSRVHERKTSMHKSKCRVLHTFHGHVLKGYFSPLTSRLVQEVERILAMLTDAVVVVSKQQRNELCGKFGIGRPEQYRVVPLGFDLNTFSQCSTKQGQFRTQLGLSQKDGPLVGIIGRLTPIKNHRLFLEAVQAVLKATEDNKTRFVIVGDGELRKDLKSLAQQLSLADRVVFTGWVNDMVPVYADLGVMALTSNNEGTPVTVIEAMAAGVPVIATDVGGVRELLSDTAHRNSELQRGTFEVCKRGVLVRPGDDMGFARGLEYLLEHPEEFKREMGQQGREYALRHHSIDRLVADMDRLYRSLLSA